MQAYQRECLQTTKSELDKLMRSKEYLNWKESAAERASHQEQSQNLSDDEIIFSDEDQNDTNKW